MKDLHHSSHYKFKCKKCGIPQETRKDSVKSAVYGGRICGKCSGKAKSLETRMDNEIPSDLQ
jgi:DNA polymerase II large subunit